ncbi:transglutaminase family protein [Mucilaginibacter terrae]|uniref:Transglutaminase-like putative cysteine protease n=1 Tax=Mucilaginibacter terrae TaxID=1955052 RepID=A0ABU3GSZ3_9SPHI|nr:transglutaminase family protein [Mucilaginibacter terrae]MDT3402899.1 transglutaminase-like putative cysteine protease [Mucilaginibacter terrae]
MPEFKIQHITRYTYEGIVRDSANQIILFPLTDVAQEVLKHDLTITGNPTVDTHTDYYGNEVGSFTYLEKHSRLVINSEVLVVTHPKELPPDTSPAQEQWQKLNSLQYIVPYIDFLKPEYFEALPELINSIEQQKQEGETPYQTALRFTEYIYNNFDYVPGVTTVESTLDEVWKLKAGVCQDFAHLLIQILRLLKIPARYVSGYICPNHNGMRGEGATHAWAEVYIPDYGWIGIDPTNNCVANERHVRLAVGRNFSDCSPVKGVYKGNSGHMLEVKVSVEYRNQAMAQPEDPIAADSFIQATEAEPFTTNSYRRYQEIMLMQQQQQQQ